MGQFDSAIANLGQASTLVAGTSAQAPVDTARTKLQQLNGGVIAPPVPAWRANRAVGQWAGIPGTDNLVALLGDPSWAANIDASCGVALDENGRMYLPAGGGHATLGQGGWKSINLMWDLDSDNPKCNIIGTPFLDKNAWWDPVRLGSDGKAVVLWPCGPRSRTQPGAVVTCHTYNSLQSVYAAHAHDGVPRIGAWTRSAAVFDGVKDNDPNSPTFGKYCYTNGLEVEAMRLDGTWEAPGFYPNAPVTFDSTNTIDFATAVDRRDGKVYGATGLTDTLVVWDPKTRTAQKVKTTPIYPSRVRLTPMTRLPMAMDSKRNCLVAVVNNKTYPTEVGLSLMKIDVTTFTVTYTKITGDLVIPNTAEGRSIVVDEDNDRYLYFNFTTTAPIVFRLISIDPDSAVTTDIGPYPNAPSAGGVGYSADGRPQWNKALGGVAYLQGATKQIQFYPTR